MMLRLVYSLILILLSFQLGQSQTISLDMFLELVQQRHPFFAKEALSSEIEKESQASFLGDEDWIVRSAPYLAYQKPLATSEFAAESFRSTGFETGLERSFWKTGGRLSLSWSSDFTNQTLPDIVVPLPPEISPEPFILPIGPSQFYQNKILFTYSQPLLQNYKGKLDKLNYDLSGYTVDFTQLQALENQEVYLLDLGTRFLDWVLLSEQKHISNERLRLADEELQRTTRKRAANLVDKVDVLRAEDAVRIAKQNIVLIESQWKAKQVELAVLSRSQELYNQNPELSLYKTEALPSADEATSKLKEQSRLLRALGVQSEQLSRQHEGFAESGRPQLALNVSGGLQEGNNEFGNSLGLNKPDVAVSLEFSYPLGNRTARADMSKTDLQLQQLEKEMSNVELELEAGVRNLLIQIKDLENVLALNREQIESAREKTEEELRLYNQGRGDLTFVIQSRDNEERAKLIYAQNGASYHKLILQYRALVDELISSGTTKERE